MSPIFETAVFDGAGKRWRILNLATGTVYASDFDTQDEALAAIEDGQVRGSRRCRRATLGQIAAALAEAHAAVGS